MSCDLKEGVQYVYDKMGNLKYDIYAIGVSMGSNLLFRYQALYPEHSKFKALISLCNPFDPELACGLMKETPFEPYIATDIVMIPRSSPTRDQIEKKYDINLEEMT